MEREIKFRAWISTVGIQKMHYLRSFIPYGEGWHGGNPDYKYYELLFGENGFMKVTALSTFIMQFTGLKDKNGKEIYEGDIIDAGHNVVCMFIIYFKDGGFWYKHPDESTDVPFAGHSHLKSILSRFHVIGNIHENPELLTPAPARLAGE